MKSRTLSSKGTLFKKNLTRFLPFWGLYLLCLLLGLMTLSGGDREFYVVMNLGESARIMAVVNCGFALLAAQLLFGDLYDSRMCSGLHCLPLRREEIFGVNILTGLLVSLIPTLLMALCSLPLMLGSQVENAWQLSFMWLAAANLEFVFFFGLAVFCVFLAGNRFSMAVIYGIANLWSMLLMLVLETLYMPMLRGVSLDNTWCEVLSPLVHISDTPLVIVSRMNPQTAGTFRMEPSWAYLLLCAGIGAALMALALLLYRRRALETAGECIAVKKVKPAIQVLFSLVAASGFAVVYQIFIGGGKLGFIMTFSLVGLVVGWFAGAMLIEKTSRVFYKKNLLRGLLLTALVLVTFLLTWLDVFGVRQFVPKAQDVAWVRINDSYGYHGSSYYYEETEDGQMPGDALSEREAIERVILLHELALEQDISDEQAHAAAEEYTVEESQSGMLSLPVSIEYTMKDGKTVRRYYYIWAEGESGELASWLLSQPESVFGSAARELERTDGVDNIQIYNVNLPDEFLTGPEVTSLRQAILKDCREGHMAQSWVLHEEPLFTAGEASVTEAYAVINDTVHSLWFDISGDSRHTVKWLRDRGIFDKIRDQWIEDMARS